MSSTINATVATASSSSSSSLSNPGPGGRRVTLRFPAAVVAAVRANPTPAHVDDWARSTSHGSAVAARAIGATSRAANQGRQDASSAGPTQRGKKKYSETKGSKDSRSRQAEQRVCEREARAVVDPDILAAVEEEGGITPAGRLLRACAQTIVALQQRLEAALGEDDDDDERMRRMRRMRRMGEDEEDEEDEEDDDNDNDHKDGLGPAGGGGG
ncbi:hypothetical protein A1O3_04369 [Capronia epimyces CBS 606.96]|uniref:Uncharacterized protein n=1 Tax=Capronia epimyces CBS 606.96 TaxID=1182542 RepID=W9YYP9_9EURO|nr:uncharacterized protein A1O3_04369 [Capronia epimyces CBS 606.96]EXJ87409.1 hypothetical protein A1O3_04369 [Capronia epimyces CBS 606.96]